MLGLLELPVFFLGFIDITMSNQGWDLGQLSEEVGFNFT